MATAEHAALRQLIELFPKLEDTELELDALGQRLTQRRSELNSE